MRSPVRAVMAVVYDRIRGWSPLWIRRWAKSQRWFIPVARACVGHDVYSASYYDDVERLESDSVEHLAEWIQTTLRPDRIIDVGCGPGHLMAALARRQVSVFGVDISRESMHRLRRKGLKAETFDLTDGGRPLPGGGYDVAISCEVAEHLEERHAQTFVRHLVGASDVVLLTAAEPDGDHGPGLFHFNEQPREYWIELFERQGYAYDKDVSADSAQYLGSHGVISYLATPMVFRKRRSETS